MRLPFEQEPGTVGSTSAGSSTRLPANSLCRVRGVRQRHPALAHGDLATLPVAGQVPHLAPLAPSGARAFDTPLLWSKKEGGICNFR